MLKVSTMRLIHAEEDTFQVNISLFWRHTPSNVIKERLWNIWDCAAENPDQTGKQDIVCVVSLDERGDLQAKWEVRFWKRKLLPARV